MKIPTIVTRILALLFALLTPLLCHSAQVTVSILPQKTFIHAIAGNAVDVQVLIPKGHNPATFQLSPKQLHRLTQSSVYFTTGVPFEAVLLPRIINEHHNIHIINTSNGVANRHFESHDHDHEHEHPGGKDPHFWLDPVLLNQQLDTYLDALVRLIPEKEAEFNANLQAYREKLYEALLEMDTLLAPHKGNTVMVYHPAFGYFLNRFGLKQKAIETGGKQPTPRQLATIIEEGKANDIHTLFVQPQFKAQSVLKIAEAIDGTVVAIDPLAENYIENLLAMAVAIASSYE